MLFEKNILIGVTGGIAAYKTADIVRDLKKQSANVKVIMTRDATRFVNPLTLKVLSEQHVYTDMYEPAETSYTAHISLARWADAILVCPATANTIAKAAHGIANNLLTTSILAATVPVLFCPSMNTAMYNNPIYRENEDRLLEHGYTIVSPESGELACGEYGEGRLANKMQILKALSDVLTEKADLNNIRVLVTAGPTREPIDPVRYLTNRSSGKMGYALAEQARLRGAKVTLITGPTNLPDIKGVKTVRVEQAEDMAAEVFNYLNRTDVFIMAAAVADFRAKQPAWQKMKKAKTEPVIQLEPTVDILSKAAQSKEKRIHVGFSLETENVLEHSKDKMQRKKCDLMVVNNPNEKGAGFEVDTNVVTLLAKNGEATKLEKMDKKRVADKILDRVVEMLKKQELYAKY